VGFGTLREKGGAVLALSDRDESAARIGLAVIEGCPRLGCGFANLLRFTRLLDRSLVSTRR